MMPAKQEGNQQKASKHDGMEYGGMEYGGMKPVPGIRHISTHAFADGEPGTMAAGATAVAPVAYKACETYQEAEARYERALAIRRQARDKGNALMPHLPIDMTTSRRYGGGQYPIVPGLYEQGPTLGGKAPGDDLPFAADMLHKLAVFYSAEGHVDAALRCYELDLLVRARSLYNELRSGSEAERQGRLVEIARTDELLSFHLDLAPASERAARLAMNGILLCKGRVRDLMSETMRALHQRLDGENLAMLVRLRDLQSQLAHLFYRGPGHGPAARRRYTRERVRLERAIDALEADISAQHPAYRELGKQVRVQDIQEALSHDAALVEFLVYRPVKFGVAGAEPVAEHRYAAYVVRARGRVRAVDLGPIKVVNRAVRRFRSAAAGHRSHVNSRARALDALLMEPVVPLLGKAKRIYIAPDGQLGFVPFAALVDRAGRYRIERYAFTYLTSGRDLVRQEWARAPASPPLIIADPRFTDSPFDGARAAGPLPSSSGDRASGSGNLALTGAQPGNMCKRPAPLPGTRDEADGLRRLLGDATLWVQSDATETALKEVRSPRILHIATHAFFLAEAEVRSDIQAMSRYRANSRAPGIAVNNGLLRSGIMLAGAARCGGSVEGGVVDDGILTALEVSSLDLYGTELVVLSACDTGAGDSKAGQGIYGLRRAFSVAGAETLVMSLWNVSDPASAEIMQRYYDYLLAGHGRGEAMRRVQLDLIAEGGNRAHPFYWAVYVVSGNDASLRG